MSGRREYALEQALRLAGITPANDGWTATEVVEAARTFVAYLDGSDAPVLVGPEPTDRTGLCDHCDKPQTGGAAGGGQPPEHWCDDHRPDDWPGTPDDDTDALEPWEPRVGDRVTVHYDDHSTASIADGTPGTVETVFPHIRRASIMVDRTTTTDEPDSGWHASYDELRPLVEQPAPVGPVLLVTELLGAQVGGIRLSASEAADVVDLIRKRLAQYAADAAAAQVYADWFGGAQ